MENIGMEGNISELSVTHHWAMYTCTFGHWLYYKKTYWSSKTIAILWWLEVNVVATYACIESTLFYKQMQVPYSGFLSRGL